MQQSLKIFQSLGISKKLLVQHFIFRPFESTKGKMIKLVRNLRNEDYKSLFK